MRQSEPFNRQLQRSLIALAIFSAFTALLFFCTHTSSTAIEPQQRRTQPQQQGRRRRGATQARTPARAARNYSRFLHASHRPPVAKLDCKNCHTIASPAAPDLIAAATMPSAKGYPYHDSCVGCHRQQFFRGASPPICTICHTRSSPRLTRREMHAFPKQSEQVMAREFPGYFPHELHQSLIARERMLSPARGSWIFARASVKKIDEQPLQALDNCATCHAPETRVSAPLKIGGLEETFKPEAGTFKTVPSGHASCFNCHWQSQKPTHDDCAGCHLSQSEFVKKKRARHLEAPLPGLLSANAAQWFKTWPREWPKRISIKFRHQTENHDIGCTSCHINIALMQTLNIPKADVPIATCAPCHISASPVLRKDGVTRTLFSEMSDEEKDKDNKSNNCIGCHASVIGRERPPCSHYLVLGQPCKE